MNCLNKCVWNICQETEGCIRYSEGCMRKKMKRLISSIGINRHVNYKTLLLVLKLGKQILEKPKKTQ